MHFPFRSQLRGTADLETTRLLSRILDARVRGVALPDLAETIDSANEIVLWNLAQHLQHHHKDSAVAGVFSSQPSDWVRQAARLLERALRDADAEGAVWTPVLDALAGSDAWYAILEDGHVPRSETLPSAYTRAALLAPWIAKTRDTEAIMNLLEFRAEEIHAVVAEHAPVLDRDIVARLVLTPPIVGRIFAARTVDETLGSALIDRAYRMWEKLVLENDKTPSGMKNPEDATVRSLLLRGISFPEPLRSEVLAFARNASRRPKDRQTAAYFLVLDRNTPADLLVELERLVDPDARKDILAHPHCPIELWNRLVSNVYDLIAALGRHQFTAEKVSLVFELYRRSNDARLLKGLLWQENGTIEIWRAGIAHGNREGDLHAHAVLALNARARQHPEIRAALLTSSSAAVLLALLEDRRPEEFELLMLGLLRARPDSAFALLEKGTIPIGTPFPHTLIKTLLDSPDNRHRLLGITLVSRFDPPRKTTGPQRRAAPSRQV